MLTHVHASGTGTSVWEFSLREDATEQLTEDAGGLHGERPDGPCTQDGGDTSLARTTSATGTNHAAPTIRTGPAGLLRHNSLMTTSINLLREELGPVGGAMRSVARTAAASVRQSCRPSSSSQPLQRALAGDLATGAAQEAAHAAAIDYGRHAAEVVDRALPFLHSVVRTGIAGTCLTMGVGRSSGATAGDVVQNEVHGHLDTGGLLDLHRPVVAPGLLNTSLSIAAPLALGVVGGALGSLLTDFVGVPLAGLISRQFCPVDPRVVIPDAIVRSMNSLCPGAGDDLRAAAARQQHDITSAGSDSNVHLGQTLYSLVTVARWATIVTPPLGVSGQLCAGLATVGASGMLLGAAMAVRQSTATLRVPDLAQLQALVDAGPEDPVQALEQLMATTGGSAPGAHEVPLFYARHVGRPVGATVEPHPRAAAASVAEDPQRGCMARMKSALLAAGRVIGAPASAVVTQWNASPLRDPEPSIEGASPTPWPSRMFHSGANLLASGLRRGQAMVHANWRMFTIGTVTGLLAQPLQGLERRTVLALGNALGVHSAIRPWFTASSEGVPRANRQIREERQAAVDAQARVRPPCQAI